MGMMVAWGNTYTNECRMCSVSPIHSSFQKNPVGTDTLASAAEGANTLNYISFHLTVGNDIANLQKGWDRYEMRLLRIIKDDTRTISTMPSLTIFK